MDKSVFIDRVYFTRVIKFRKRESFYKLLSNIPFQFESLSSLFSSFIENSSSTRFARNSLFSSRGKWWGKKRGRGGGGTAKQREMKKKGGEERMESGKRQKGSSGSAKNVIASCFWPEGEADTFVMDDRRPSAKAAVAAAAAAAATVGMAIAAIASVAPSAPTNCHGMLPFPVLSFPLFHRCFAQNGSDSPLQSI